MNKNSVMYIYTSQTIKVTVFVKYFKKSLIRGLDY
jgi:hypothetical protein